MNWVKKSSSIRAIAIGFIIFFSLSFAAFVRDGTPLVLRVNKPFSLIHTHNAPHFIKFFSQIFFTTFSLIYFYFLFYFLISLGIGQSVQNQPEWEWQRMRNGWQSARLCVQLSNNGMQIGSICSSCPNRTRWTSSLAFFTNTILSFYFLRFYLLHSNSHSIDISPTNRIYNSMALWDFIFKIVDKK